MKASHKWNAVRIIITSINLFAGWILFTGNFAIQSLLIGIILSFLVSFLTYDLFIHESEAAKRSLLPHIHQLVFFIILVIFKMYVASFRVTLNIVRGKINPRIVHFRTRLKADMSRLMLTNAITLTPGTITLNLSDDHLIVHWLDAKTTHSKYAGMLIKGSFEKLLQKVWI